MRTGRIVEMATTAAIFDTAYHPYTRLLLETARLSPRNAIGNTPAIA